MRRSAVFVGVVVWLAASALPAAGAWAQKKVPLRLALKQGQSYTLSSTSKLQSATSFGGIARKQTETVAVTVTLKVSKVDADGTIRAACTYDAVRVEGDGRDGKYAYDSAKGGDVPDFPAARQYAALAGLPLEVVLTSRGEVKEVTGAEEIPAGRPASTGAGDGEDDADEPDVPASSGNDVVREHLQEMFVQFPEKPVPVGHAWNVERKRGASMPLAVNRAYLLKAATNGKAYVLMKSAARSDPDAAEAVGRHDVEGTGSGTVVIDAETGWVVSANEKLALSGTVTLGTGDLDVTVPTKMQSEVTLEPPKKNGQAPEKSGGPPRLTPRTEF
jgi:hypothetical protein